MLCKSAVPVILDAINRIKVRNDKQKLQDMIIYLEEQIKTKPPNLKSYTATELVKLRISALFLNEKVKKFVRPLEGFVLETRVVTFPMHRAVSLFMLVFFSITSFGIFITLYVTNTTIRH